MARVLRSLDVSDQPELLRLAEEVSASGQPRVLRRDSEDLAIISPAKPRRATSRRGPLTKQDPLWQLVGSAADAGPTDASQKHEYLGEALGPSHQ
jgi:hypothetical protein